MYFNIKFNIIYHIGGDTLTLSRPPPNCLQLYAQTFLVYYTKCIPETSKPGTENNNTEQI